LAAKRERRRKQLLAEYYGKGESGGESGGGGDDAPKRHTSTSSSSSSVGGGGGGGGGGAMTDEAERLNLEGPHFSAAAYCDSLIGKESLAALVKRDASLEHEVARLDGEMKTLVYENYNKFISATDTIKAIKSNVEQLDHEMAALEQRMAAVGERAHRVDAHLKPKRDALLQLDAVHRLLQKLHFFVELPQRLQQCVELHSYAQAVEHYQKSAPILRKYAELASFKSIEEQCAALIKRLHADLRAQLASRDASSAQVAEAVRLLLLLGDERAVEQVCRVARRARQRAAEAAGARRRAGRRGARRRRQAAAGARRHARQARRRVRPRDGRRGGRGDGVVPRDAGALPRRGAQGAADARRRRRRARWPARDPRRAAQGAHAAAAPGAHREGVGL
jgi:uncharacterized small protein (DUF1192 family)